MTTVFEMLLAFKMQIEVTVPFLFKFSIRTTLSGSIPYLLRFVRYEFLKELKRMKILLQKCKWLFA